jgi:hypothetical protein
VFTIATIMMCLCYWYQIINTLGVSDVLLLDDGKLKVCYNYTYNHIYTLIMHIHIRSNCYCTQVCVGAFYLASKAAYAVAMLVLHDSTPHYMYCMPLMLKSLKHLLVFCVLCVFSLQYLDDSSRYW